MKNELLAVKEKFRNLSEYSKQLNRWILKSIGVWPVSSSATRTEKIVSQILVVICWCFSLFTIIPNLLRIILEKENAYRKLKTLGPLSHWFVGGYNYAVLLLRKDDIRYCIKHVKTDWTIITRPENQLVMLKHAKLGRYVASLSAGFLQGGVFCYCIVAGSTKEIIEIGNETISKHALPCPVYKIPVDTNLTHTIIFIIQFLSGFVASSSATAAFSLAITFSSHAVGQLNVMTVWINEFVNRPRGWNKNDCINRISVIVEHHLRILSLIARIERTMTTTCFMEILKCMVGMCLPGYYVLVEWPNVNVQNAVVYIMILVSMISNIFLVCYIGETITEKCKKIGDIIYTTKWYQLPEKDILNLIMIISRSGVEVKITAGKLINTSVYTFGNVVKTVFTYLNMLRQTTIM
ncbi:PREDICTED: odorant receptor 4-like [Eufriesea mexicana]|uniref:odorant receptor 4-like n=1 Tax=Eufriesea mexicana TaxID=516756 RepID=UPI00083C3177|nr:PREDICTED: odorant receptor 4-like [Eufriesea mexicana]